ncbi:hypothetical protein CR513_18167, partial [Mucuna pruriens]
MFLDDFHLICWLDISSNSFLSRSRRGGDDELNSYVFFFFFFSFLPHVPVLEEVSIVVKAEAFIGGDLLAEIGVGVEAPQAVKRSRRSVRVIVLVPGGWRRGRVGEGSAMVMGFGGVVSAEEATNDGEEDEYDVEGVPAVLDGAGSEDARSERL